MRKRVFGSKLSRGKGARRALFRSLTRSLVTHGSIRTTKAKAKAVRSDLNKVIGLSKEGGVAKRRQVYALLGNDRETTENLFKKIAPQLKDRPGGFVRIIKLPRRRGDMAEMVRLEWVKEIGKKSEDKSDKSKRGKMKKPVVKKSSKGKSRITGKKK